LRERAHFDEVYLLADGVATRDNIRAHLRNKAPQLLDKNDLFLLYFEGHGVGADLGLPTLLAFDSTLENGQEDGLELETFARDLQTWIQSGSFLIVTDAIHHNQLDGIYFYGPSAEQWPRMPQGTMIISSSKSNTPAKDGEFGIAFADAVAGAADANQDRKVQADEFYTYMSERLKSKNQMPIVAGDYDTSFIIAEDVTPGLTSQAGFGPIEEDSDVVYPDTRIRKAKFVWREGTSQQVHCRQAPVMSCAPMCYVNAFKAGPCRLSAVVKGQSLKGSVIVLEPGAYECSEENGKLACSGP